MAVGVMPRQQQITVSGPGREPRACESTGGGVSYAQHLATQATAPGTFYVRDETERVLYRVERIEHGVVLTVEVGR